MDEMERAGALYLTFEDVDDENDNDWKEMEEKMRTKLVERVENWLSKVEALDDEKMEESTGSGDVASMFTVGSALTGVTCVCEEKGEVETCDWLKKSEAIEKDEDEASGWIVTAVEGLEDSFECKKGNEVKVKVCG